VNYDDEAFAEAMPHAIDACALSSDLAEVLAEARGVSKLGSACKSA
jgi:hypothetical protein